MFGPSSVGTWNVCLQRPIRIGCEMVFLGTPSNASHPVALHNTEYIRFHGLQRVSSHTFTLPRRLQDTADPMCRERARRLKRAVPCFVTRLHASRCCLGGSIASAGAIFRRGGVRSGELHSFAASQLLLSNQASPPQRGQEPEIPAANDRPRQGQAVLETRGAEALGSQSRARCCRPACTRPLSPFSGFPR